MTTTTSNQKKKSKAVKKTQDSRLEDSMPSPFEEPTSQTQTGSPLPGNSTPQVASSSASNWFVDSNIQTLDFLSHNVLACELLNFEGVEKMNGESEADIKSRCWQELKTVPAYSDCLSPSSTIQLPTGPLLRVKMAKILELLEAMGQELDEESLDAHAIYQGRKGLSNASFEVISLLITDFSEPKFINSSAFINILLELKNHYVISEMYAGIWEDEAIRNYRKGEGKALIKKIFGPEMLPNISEPLISNVTRVFEERETQILNLLNNGKMTFDEFNLSELDSSIKKFLARVFADLNERQMPEMHPDYQEVAIIKNSKDASHSFNSQFHQEHVAHLLNAVEAATHHQNHLTPQSALKEMGLLYDNMGTIVDEFAYGPLTPSLTAQSVTKPKSKKRSRAPTENTMTENGEEDEKAKKPTQKRPWTVEENKCLEDGMALFGNDWKAIKAHFPEGLAIRSNVNLKDRARNVKRKLAKQGGELGVWASACK